VAGNNCFGTCSILGLEIGWRGWSLDYAVPILCVAALLVMYITAKVMRLSARDYISYFLLGGLFGIVPVLFILFDIVKVDYPSLSRSLQALYSWLP